MAYTPGRAMSSYLIVCAPQSGAVPQEDLVFAAGIAAFLRSRPRASAARGGGPPPRPLPSRPLRQPGSVAVAVGLSTRSSAASCPASVARCPGRSPAHRAKGHSR